MSEKRKPSGPNSDQKPDRKKGKEDMEVDDPFSPLNQDLFLSPSENFAPSDGDIDDEAAGGPPVGVEAVQEEAEGSGDVETENQEVHRKPEVETHGEPEKRKVSGPEEAVEVGSEDRKVATKRAPSRGDPRAGKKKKKDAKSHHLVTITKTDIGPISSSTFKKITDGWNNEIFDNIKEGKTTGQFVPRIDFTSFHTSRILIGCADYHSAQWVMDAVRRSGEDLEAWDRNVLSTFTTYIPKPTSERDTQEIIKAIMAVYNVPGSIVQLKTQETNNGKIIVVGMTPSAKEYLEGLDLTVHVGLCRVKFTELKPREGQDLV